MQAFPLKKIFLSVFLAMALVRPVKDAIAANGPIHLNSSQNPWRAIGLISTSNKKCVATIIGSNILLSSAYCLLGEDNTKIKDSKDLIFKVGFKDGFYLLRSPISSVLTSKKMGFPPAHIEDTKNSWAFLFTPIPLSSNIPSVQLEDQAVDSAYLHSHKIITVGYDATNTNQLVASIKCQFNSVSIKYNDQHVAEGSSAPILLQSCQDYFQPLIGSPVVSINQNNLVKIIGIVSATLTSNGKAKGPRHISVILPTTTFLDQQNYAQHHPESSRNGNDLLNQKLEGLGDHKPQV